MEPYSSDEYRYHFCNEAISNCLYSFGYDEDDILLLLEAWDARVKKLHEKGFQKRHILAEFQMFVRELQEIFCNVKYPKEFAKETIKTNQEYAEEWEWWD